MDEIMGRFMEATFACMGEELLRIKKLLEALRACDGVSSPSWGDRVQGGEHAPTAERRMEIQDCLNACLPMGIAVVRLFAAQREKKTAAYCYAIMDGLYGEEQMKTRGIGADRLRQLRRWLYREVSRIQKKYGGGR